MLFALASCRLITGWATAHARQPSTGVPSASDASTPVPLLSFHTIDAWAELTDRGSVAPASGAREHLARSLAQYLDVPVSDFILSGVSLSPLEWPGVLAGQKIDPRRQRLEIRQLMSAMGVRYREVVPLDIPTASLADTIARAIAEDMPVITNTPRLSVIYGYDRREPDTWWRVDSEGATELVLESERIERFVLWDEDPTAAVLWIITGVEGLRRDDPRPDLSIWPRLRTIAASVHGVPADGIRAYPLSLRDLREHLLAADSVPPLAEPIDSTDPLGIRTARRTRESLSSALDELAQVTTDTSESRPLKLAQYYYSNSVRSLNELEDLLYGGTLAAAAWVEFAGRCRQASARGRAGVVLTDMLEAEKQAAEAIDRVLAAHDTKPAPKPPPPPPRRRHRR